MTITMNDRGHKGAGGALTTRKEILLSIEPQNDPPRLYDVPTNITAQEDTTLELPIMYFEDDDLLSHQIIPLFELSVSVQHGEILSTDEEALQSMEIQLQESNTIRVVGNADSINRILASMTYRGDENFNTEDEVREETLRIEIRDVTDNFGETLSTAEILKDQVEIPIHVLAVNDLPTLHIPDTQIVRIEGLKLDLSPEEMNQDVRVTLSVSNEYSTLSFYEYHVDVNVTTISNRTLTLMSQDVNAINTMLGELTYTRITRFEGGDSITMTVNDNHVTTMDIFVHNRDHDDGSDVPIIRSLSPNRGSSLGGMYCFERERESLAFRVH